MEPWLTPQDAARFSAHVTIQNKVSPEVARSTLAEVAGDFTPYEALATGLAMWRYVGGPWEPVLVTPFSSPGTPGVLCATPRSPGAWPLLGSGRTDIAGLLGTTPA